MFVRWREKTSRLMGFISASVHNNCKSFTHHYRRLNAQRSRLKKNVPPRFANLTARVKPNIYRVKRGKYVKCYTRQRTCWSHLKALLRLLSSARPHGKRIFPRHKTLWKPMPSYWFLTLQEKITFFFLICSDGSYEARGGQKCRAARMKQWKLRFTFKSTSLLSLQPANSMRAHLFPFIGKLVIVEAKLPAGRQQKEMALGNKPTFHLFTLPVEYKAHLHVE